MGVIGQFVAEMFKQALIKCGRRLHHEEGYVNSFTRLLRKISPTSRRMINLFFPVWLLVLFADALAARGVCRQSQCRFKRPVPGTVMTSFVQGA